MPALRQSGGARIFLYHSGFEFHRLSGSGAGSPRIRAICETSGRLAARLEPDLQLPPRFLGLPHNIDLEPRLPGFIQIDADHRDQPVRQCDPQLPEIGAHDGLLDGLPSQLGECLGNSPKILQWDLVHRRSILVHVLGEHFGDPIIGDPIGLRKERRFGRRLEGVGSPKGGRLRASGAKSED